MEKTKTKKLKAAITPDEYDVETQKTRDLLVQTLEALGCQPTVNREEPSRVDFSYHGEHFYSYAGGRWLSIWYDYWKKVRLDDLEDFARFRKAINIANTDSDVTTIYEMNKKEGVAYAHSKRMFLFVPEIPRLDVYLSLQIINFFHPQRIVELEMERMRRNEGALNYTDK